MRTMRATPSGCCSSRSPRVTSRQITVDVLEGQQGGHSQPASAEADRLGNIYGVGMTPGCVCR
jgi:hypothetical protein